MKILLLLESEALAMKVEEAMQVLRHHYQASQDALLLIACQQVIVGLFVSSNDICFGLDGEGDGMVHRLGTNVTKR